MKWDVWNGGWIKTYLDRRSPGPIAGNALIRRVRGIGQTRQPTDVGPITGHLGEPDGVPDARQPMGDQGERGHEEDEDRGSVFGVSIDLARNSDQPQQTRGLQQTDQRGRLMELID